MADDDVLDLSWIEPERRPPAAPRPPAGAAPPARAAAGLARPGFAPGKHRLTKVARYSRPAAAFAVAMCASVSLAGACAETAVPASAAPNIRASIRVGCISELRG